MQLFPFHFFVNRELVVLQMGSQLAALFSGGAEGRAMSGLFSISSPPIDPTYEDLCRIPNELFMLDAKKAERSFGLRGGFSEVAEGMLLFLGSLTLQSTRELGELGLKFRDFRVHDPTISNLSALQAQSSILRDAQRLSAERTETDARFHQLWENAADAFFACDAAGRFLDVNGQASRALGYTREELLQLSMWDISVGVDEERWRNRLPLCGERALTVEGVHRRKDGTTFPVEIRIAAAPGHGDGAVMALARDVTERHHALEELRRSEEQYRSLIDHATQGIYRSDTSGHFLAVNSALVEMLGYGSADELMAVDITRDVYVDPAERSELLDRHRNEGRVEEEVRWRRRDGGEIIVTLRGRAISVDDDDTTEVFEVIVDDVTEQRSIEAQLRQAQKMEAVGQLTGGIAHDFNNVLAAILTNAQLLTMTLPPQFVEEGSELHDIECAARRGADLIKKLMAFSRDDHLDLESVDPSEILKETVDLLKCVLPESIELTLEQAHAGALINVDRSGIQQILLNLATNARDAMPKGGTLAISTLVSGPGTGRSEVDGEPRVQITIRDTGAGMNAETLERAFEPFFTTKDRGKGTGLGLAMVYTLVQRHGGTIEVASEPGVGTTFTVGLPVAEPDEQRTRKREAVQREPSVHSGKTVLFVEDEAPLRRASQRALERFGYRVLLAENGLQALELLEAHGEEISLVVTDLIMPEKGGGDLYEATSDWKPRPAFLMTTGYRPREVAGRFLDDDVPVLRKPWDVTGLLEAVEEALGESKDSPPMAAS